jgi:bromodomain and PHD finger-containing protein 1
MCNLAVHQECYGVPYIPEGQWLCRRCIQSPSTPVSCVLCPNKYGAFKQTDTGEWCHVVCAIWIPEVHFANTVFLEPIIGMDCIDKARWKLMCFICRKRNVGACIQCDKQNCYTAFHVTCAQQAGLFMNIQEEHDETLHHHHHNEKAHKKRRKTLNKSQVAEIQAEAEQSSLVEVRKRAYCDLHTPVDVLSPHTRAEIKKSGAYNSVEYEEALKRAKKLRMKKARKILAEKRNAPPVISLPVIPDERIKSIVQKVSIEDREGFFAKLMSYWLLKRYSRNGVPLLRRLQNSAIVRKQNSSLTPTRTVATAATATAEVIDSSSATTPTKKSSSAKKGENLDVKKLKEQLMHCRKLRQDLEKARILMELVRKRERMKRDMVRIEKLVHRYELNPFNGVFLQSLLNQLIVMDTNAIFTQPVDGALVPTYYTVIKQPMDFSKMQEKINQMAYRHLDEFEVDFKLIISNCFQFNPKNDFYYRVAAKLREKVNERWRRHVFKAFNTRSDK